MQDMTDHKCYIAEVGETKQLIDSRDGKKYWVSKLADGNCWMVQNLALDLSTSRTLTPNDTDIPTDWTPSIPTVTAPNRATFAPIAEYYGLPTTSYNPGNFVNTKPVSLLSSACIISGQNIDLSFCSKDGWVNVSELVASNDPTFGANIKNGQYNAHYLLGNIYSYNAAIAEYGSSLTSSMNYPLDAPQSICPKGWQLPSSLTSKSFSNLLSSYGAYVANSFKYGNQDIRLSPLYLALFGYAGWDMESYGLEGTWHTSTKPSYLAPPGNVDGNTPYYNQDVISLSIYGSNANNTESSAISPSNTGRAWGGRSVRCVAR